jgi:hypothetical protein
MEYQYTSGHVQHRYTKILSIVFRGILGGLAGGFVAAMLFGAVFYDLAQLFQIIHAQPFSISIRTAIQGGVWLGLPFGLIIGLSTGILAATFRQHCPMLLVWLVLSWIAVIAGFYINFLDLPDRVNLVGITFISLAASWIAYKLTIQKIKRDIHDQASQAYTVLASVINFFLIFVMMYGFFYLIQRMEFS